MWSINPEDIFKILLAVIAGGIIGVEREARDKAAGFRTLIFICVGAALFTILSVQIAGDRDPGRIAAQIVTGIGFLGAGVIIRDNGRVVGLTTAAAIWLTAAVGMSIGVGMYLLALGVTATALIVLVAFPSVELFVDRANRLRTYEFLTQPKPEVLDYMSGLFTKYGLRVRNVHVKKSDESMRLIFDVTGSIKQHTLIEKVFFDEPNIIEFNY
jgi:putative Mg2+ transporter-C (MgtC) family protein